MIPRNYQRAAVDAARVNDPATLRQIELLQRAGHAATGLDFGLSKYAAKCHLNFRWNRAAITAAVLKDMPRRAA